MSESFIEIGKNKACLAIHFDATIGDKQRRIVLDELASMEDCGDEYAELAYSFFESIQAKYDGGFIFVFDDRTCYLKDEVIEKMLSAFNDHLCNTSFVSNLSWMDSVENCLDEIIEHSEDIIPNYIDAQISCGYTISKKNLNNIFKDHFSEDEINKHITFYMLKDSSKFSN